MDQLAYRLQALLEGQYVIDRELGRGGMATVYLARDLRHDRLVAIKLLQPELTTAVTAERFLREIAITAKLQHPHILTLIDSGAAEGLVYYVMPNVEGESLRDRLIWEKQLSIDHAIHIAREVASALNYAHAQGVIHRDIKPENILLSAGHAVVADFGIARAVRDSGQQVITQVGLPLGTPAYMSPEQAGGREDIDHRSDIYALGCVLFEMLAGRPPFVAPTVSRVIQLHISEPPPAITTIRTSAPPAMDEILKRALAKDPGDRFQTAKEFEEALGLAGAVETLERATPSERLRLATPIDQVSVRPYGSTPHLFKRLLILGGILAAMALVAIAVVRNRAAARAAAPGASAGAAAYLASIGVKPFEPIGNDSAARALASGIGVEVSTQLARVKRLKVISGTTMEAAASKRWTTRQMADSLEIQFLLEGSVQRSGGELLATLRLVDARTDALVWTESYRRALRDVLLTQEEIGRKVVEALATQVQGLRAAGGN